MEDLQRLLIAARDGDRLAFTAVIRVSQAEVWRLAAHLVGWDEADDVTQDIYVRAWRALGSFRAESTGRTWLLAIARRACADAVRRRVRRRRLEQRAAAQAPPPGAQDAAGVLAVLDLARSLEPARREAFALTQIAGCSYAEAAEICAVPVGTIRSRVARARADLLEQLRAAEEAGAEGS